MDRNTKGMIGFGVLSVLLGIVTLLIMIGREIYQYFTYLKPNKLSFEWDDIARYGLIILICSLFHWCICDLLNFPIWTMF